MKESKGNIVIAGGTGLVGSRLVELLEAKGYTTTILTRDSKKSKLAGFMQWSPSESQLDLDNIEQPQAVVNLAGAGVMDHAWTDSYKKTIIQSRVDSNRCLGEAMASLKSKPVYVSASAIGYYGYRESNEAFHEDDTPTKGDFLQEVTKEWEAAGVQAGQQASRHVIVRIGIVMSAQGGALQEMEKGFVAGIGSYFSPGNQMYSWIHIDDLCGIIIHAIEQEVVDGVYNGVAPNPVVAKALAGSIAEAKYGKVRLLPVPKFASKLALGQRQKILTGSCKVSADKILRSGFKFHYPTIDSAMSDIIKN